MQTTLSEGEGSDSLTVIAITSIEDADLFDQNQAAASRAQAAKSPRDEMQPPPKSEVTPLAAEADPVAPPEKTVEADKTEPKVELAAKPEPKLETGVSQEASAPSVAQEALRAAAANAARQTRLLKAYEREMHEAIERAKVRPQVRRNAKVLVEMAISPSGVLLGRSIIQTSGLPELDAAALQSIDRAAPYPSIPPEIGAAPMKLTVPFEYGSK